jgi:hypothetical protein
MEGRTGGEGLDTYTLSMWIRVCGARFPSLGTGAK